jgi:hypothetical protein
MGYYLQAFICRQGDINVLVDNFENAIEVVIGQGLTIVPMTENLFNEMNNFSVSKTIDKFELLTEEIEKKIIIHTNNKKIAYVEAEYFGGEGGQMAICWENLKRQQFLNFAQDRINQVLKDFGVVAQIGKDEFDTLGFGRYRFTNEWIENNKE